MPRSRDELMVALLNQMKAARRSLEAFGQGDRWEVARAATAVTTIVYDRGKTQSILSQLSERDKVAFIHTGQQIDYRNIVCEFPLAILSGPIERCSFKPLFGEDPATTLDPLGQSDFKRWWDGPVIKTAGDWPTIGDDLEWYKEHGAKCITRGELTLSLRDQDGGAHFDNKLRNSVYRTLTKEGSGWFVVKSTQEQFPVLGVESATMAQVTWELLTSLLNHFSSIPTDF